MFILIKRIFRSGWQGITREGGIILANVFVMALAISVITSLFFFQEISRFLIDSLQERVDVSVYFKYEAAEEDMAEVRQALSAIPQVKEVNYISKEEALENFTARHEQDAVLMESLTEVGANPFLASLGVIAFQASQYESVVSFLEDSEYNHLIEKIDYYERKPVIESVYNATANFNRIGLIFSIILVLIAVAITFNTVKLSIHSSREEMKIQKLVGASNLFVRGPFLAQGVICGFLAAVFCLVFFFLLLWGIDSRVEMFFPGLGLFAFFQANIWTIVIIQLGGGLLLGFFSSLIAVRRYLKV